MAGQWKLTNSIEEDHRKPIFCITFNMLDPHNADLFASCGANRASVYRCGPDGEIELMQAYTDEDQEESFYVCKWSVREDTGAPLLLLAGQNGIVRIIDCSTHTLVDSISVHGNSINDITVLPQNPSLLLTASKDESVRLWNLKTKTCVLILSGDGGHTNEVLSLDFHPWDGSRFLSAGMDNMVKVWSLKEHWSLVEQSLTWSDTTRAFPTTYVHRPVFSSSQVHANYVDCVRWLGDLVLSKSVDFEILLWKPDSSDEPGVHVQTSFQLLKRFPLPESKMWFVRFSLDAAMNTLVCGNRVGKVYVYHPHEPLPTTLQPLKTRTAAVVRQTAVSNNGFTVLAACEDGTIWRWDKQLKARLAGMKEVKETGSEVPSATGSQAGMEPEVQALEDSDADVVDTHNTRDVPGLPGR